MSNCRKISINETQYNVLKRTLLTESQESKSISAAKKLLQQRLGYDEKQADDFVRVKLRNDLPVLRTPEGGKFILGVTRMFLDGELRTANDINSLNSTLKLVASEAHINEYDRNLNGISSQDLISKFAKAMSDNMDAEKEEINNMTFGTPSDYNIVRIDSFDEAQEYSKFTSWCVTHYENMFDSYTSDGINQFYFCLKNGFENERPIEGEDCPLDKYGLSMIAVSVNENGMLNTCTCRWNHDNGGNDNIMTAKEISQVIGQNFYNVFLPNNKWKTIVDNALQRLANGESVYDVFDLVGIIYNGITSVKLNGKWNFINTEGSFISNQWFDAVDNFSDGIAKVELNDKYNFINTEGTLISNQWFDYVDGFKDGFARVELDDKTYKLDSNGQLYTLNLKPITLESVNMNKKITITESQFQKLILESQESKSISQAVALVMQRMGYDKTKADNFVRGEIRASFPVLRDKNAGKFILGVTRMFLDGDIKDGQTINRLNSSIKLLSTDHYDEYDRNLNGLKANDVIERFATSLQANIDNDRQELANQTYNNTSEYQIVPIDSYEEASAFSPYVSWCVTKSPHAFNNYTNDGVGQFYFCLKHGWKTMQEEVGDGTPLDEYGLSMIAVCVDSDGALQSCTCRWNHANGGNDAIMTTKEISQVIGQNFYDVFKPNNRLQRLVDDIKMRLQDGAQYKDVFSVCQAFGEHSLVVQLKQPRKWAIFSEDGDLLSSLYSDITSNLTKDIHDTIKTMIDSQGYYHLVDEYGKDYAQGNLINDCWFDRIKGKEYIHCKLGSYDDGGDLYNLFDHRKKEWLFNKNVGKAEIHEDFPYIVIDNEMGKENLFEPETKTLVFDKWYDLIYPNLWFKTFFLVRDYLYNDGSSNRKENLYDLSKKSFVFDEWVDEIDWPNNYGDVKITKDHKCNLFDLYNGKYITDLWFDDMYLDVCVIVVGDDEKGYNILNNERTDVAYPIWFSRVKSDGYSRTSGLVQARYNGATWWINKSGQLYLWDEQRENFKQIPLENLLNYDNTGVQESVNMNKKVIITESQFASLQNLLLIEAATIQDIQQKYYPNIDLNIMRQILSQGDPTWRQEKPDKMGKYGKWLLWLYQNRQLKLEDLYKAKEYLTYFIKFAQKIEDKDINHYKTLPQLYLTVKPFMDDPTQASSHQDEIRTAKEGAEKVYEDDVWLIVVPHTEEAAKYYGKNTQWCTAADNGNQFNYYNSQGPLYININKADNEKYQFHFESDQFMDETDTPIEEPIVENIPITSGAIAWYRENVDQWQMLRRQKIDFYVKDDIEANFYKYPETDWWLEDGSGNKIMENLRDVDIFIDQIWEEMNSNGWSDIPCTEGGSKLLVLSNESRYINGGYRSRFSLESLGGPYSHIECMSDSWDEYSYKVFKCVRPDGKITVKGQNDYHFNTFDASEIDDIFMYGDIIFYKFEDGQYIIQNMDDDEFNTVQIPERFEGQLNYDEWPYMYWIYTDNGHEMKINMETFDYRYLHADNYDENEDF